MKKTETFTIPAGFGGIMNYSPIETGKYQINRYFLVITEANKSQLSGFIEYPDGDGVIAPDILAFLTVLEPLLSSRGVYRKV